MQAIPPVESVRQKTVIAMSDRMVRDFKQNTQRIAKKQGLPYDKAAAILAASTRRASAAARRRNPRLNKVNGKGDNK
jgi:predicted DsbA family dithiol-disulfide isomerase